MTGDQLDETVADLGYIKRYAAELRDNPEHPSRSAYLQQIYDLADKVYRRLPVGCKEGLA